MSLPINFRDVGKSIDTITGTRLLKTGVIFRSARPGEGHASILQSGYGIRTILDLRTDTERLDHGVSSTGTTADIRTEVVDFNGRSYSTALLRQLSYWQTTQFLGYYALGYRREAIKILGENVLAVRGLIGLAQDSIKHCTAEVKAVFDVLSTSNNLPCLIHCTQGKDRTGLVVLLVLLLLEVPLGAIDEDYLVSQKQLEVEREQRLSEIRSIGLPDSFADCAQGWTDAVVNHLNETYGGIKPYLRHCQVTDEQQQRVIESLRA